jgi:hypothetical protein
MLEATERGHELCQWEEEIDGEYAHVCFRRSQDVYLGRDPIDGTSSRRCRRRLVR